jgi:hypothetical protein
MNVDWLFLFLPQHHFIFEIKLQITDLENLGGSYGMFLVLQLFNMLFILNGKRDSAI